MPSPEFSISVHDLDASGRSFRLPVRAAWIRGVLEATDVSPTLDDGHIDLRLSKSGRDVVVRGTLRAEVTVPCARCLGPASICLEEELSALAVQTTKAPSGKMEADAGAPDDGNTIAYDGGAVVLDDFVRDELLLGIPMIPLCSESCPGIRPHDVGDSAGVSVDPRLRPLLSLKKS